MNAAGMRRLQLHQRVGCWSSRGVRGALRRLELVLTPCIVSHPPVESAALVTPANERLDGTQFTPAEAEAQLPGARASAIVYPCQTVDGLVHEFGGAELLRLAHAVPYQRGGDLGERCRVGHAVCTPAAGELLDSYQYVVHAVAPVYPHAPAYTSAGADGRVGAWRRLMVSTYHSALTAAAEASISSLAIPLLGAGARGAPVEDAARAAAHALLYWRGGTDVLHVVHVAVQRDDIAEALLCAIDSEMNSAPAAQAWQRDGPASERFEDAS